MDETETFKIINEIVHPQFNPRTFEWDFMIIRLDGSSSNTPIKLNVDSKIPSDGSMLSLAGFGDTDPSSWGDTFPDTLQQVAVKYVENSVCEQSSSFSYSYEGEITADMLCARDDGKDSCQGDSGSPLIIAGATAEEDLQVGIVSWYVQSVRWFYVSTVCRASRKNVWVILGGLTLTLAHFCFVSSRGMQCADMLFPGVYARVSEAYPWIRAVVCSISSEDAPSYFDCKNAPDTFPPVRAPAPVENPITFTYEFTTDAAADENELWIERVNGLEVQFISSVSDLPKEDVYTKMHTFEEGALYAMIMKDKLGDGVKNGELKLFLENDNGTRIQIRQLDSQLLQQKYYVVLFYATLSDDVSRFDDDKSFDNEVPLTFEITFDDYPEEVGMEIRSVDGTLLFYRPPRYYFEHVGETVQEVISFPPQQQEYYLSVVDVFGDGLGDKEETGYVLKSPDGAELVRNSFVGGKGEAHKFTWPVRESTLPPVVKPTAKAPTPAPTPPPTSAIPPKQDTEDIEDPKDPGAFDTSRGGLDRRLRRSIRGSS